MESVSLDYTHCTLCPRKCGVDRTKTRGFCGMGAELTAARAMLHYGEEPVISGAFGSGAVFFSGCTLRCLFCQNAPISAGGFGKALTSAQLRAVFERLIDEGAQNINLVTPTHFLPTILPALTPKLPVPVVYNCGGYERVETLRLLEGKVDIYLPDFKYSDNRLALRLSAAGDYFEVASAAIREMVRQTGRVCIEDDEMKRGVLIRHLVLPGCVENSLGVVDWVAQTFEQDEVLLSLMSQYVPMGKARSAPPFDRRVTEEEYAAVCSWAQLCGIRAGFTQERNAATTAETPSFDLSGLSV